MARYERLMRRLLDKQGLNFSDRIVIRPEDVRILCTALVPDRPPLRKLMARQCLTLVQACLRCFRRRRTTNAIRWWRTIQAQVEFCGALDPSLVREFTLSLVKARRENSRVFEVGAMDHTVNGLETRTPLETALDFLDDRFFIEGLLGCEDEVELAAKEADAALLDELQEEVDKAMRQASQSGGDGCCTDMPRSMIPGQLLSFSENIAVATQPNQLDFPSPNIDRRRKGCFRRSVSDSFRYEPHMKYLSQMMNRSLY